MWFRKEKKPDPADTMRDLRKQALTVDAATLGVKSSASHPKVWGILMETGYPTAVATLVVLADGATSLYFSTGGGVIGAGDHASVRATHPAFFSTAEAHIGDFVPATATPLPVNGRVRFYLRTFGGTLTAEASEDDLGNRRHALSPLFHAAHAVIAAVRVTSGG